MPRIESLTCADLERCDTHLVTNPLYVTRDLHANGLVWSWRTTPRSQVREWITLAAANDERLQVAIHGDAVNLGAPLLDWRDHSGTTQLLAWTVAHEPLIDLIRTVFQREFIPVAIEDCDAPASTSCMRVGFSTRKLDGTPIAAGSVRLPAHTIERCSAQVSDAPRVPGCSALEGVRAHLPIVIDAFAVNARDIAAVAPGCIVRLDNHTLRTPRPRIAIGAGGTRLIADIQDLRARVVGSIPAGADIHHLPQGASMNEHTAADAAPHTPSLNVATVPVRLTFNAGRLMLPFGALADIKPGYVFELDRRLNDQTIAVQANDVTIATGELVVLGDFLGVRITRLLPTT